MNWDIAHRIAGIASVQAHRDLGVDRSDYVDVFAALRAAGLTGVARPMPRLFGMYVAPSEDNDAGVLLNAGLDLITQRYTAAHELGHHRLEHHTAFDEDLDRSMRWGDGIWSDEEKTAEAFACWFLMPRPAVLAALARIDVRQPHNPEHAYQVAGWLGTSYAGTVRHMARLRLITRDCAESWLKITPAAIKRTLVAGAVVPPRARVHVIAAGGHGATLRVGAEDCLMLRLPAARFGALPEGVVPIGEVSGDTVGQMTWNAIPTVKITKALTARVALAIDAPSLAEPFRLTLVPEAPRQGVCTLWPI